MRTNTACTRCHGFTLIEVVLVMGLVGVLVGTALLTAGSGQAEKKLREISGLSEDMIYQARSLSILQQRAYQVTFREGTIELAPLGEPKDSFGYEGKDDFFWNKENEDETPIQSRFPDVRKSESYSVDEVEISIQRWGEKALGVIEKDKVVRLKFDPSGLVEPITLRTSRGASYLQVEFSPLSGGVKDEEMYIVKAR